MLIDKIVNIEKDLKKAIKNDDLEKVKEITVAMPMIVSKFRSELWLPAIKCNNLEILNIVMKDANQYTKDLALVEAAKYNKVENARFLIDIGAETIEEALIASVFWRNSRIMEFLLERGADPNYNDAEALFIAVENGYMEPLSLLIKYGVDLSINNYEIFKIAIKAGQKATLDRMIEAIDLTYDLIEDMILVASRHNRTIIYDYFKSLHNSVFVYYTPLNEFMYIPNKKIAIIKGKYNHFDLSDDRDCIQIEDINEEFYQKCLIFDKLSYQMKVLHKEVQTSEFKDIILKKSEEELIEHLVDKKYVCLLKVLLINKYVFPSQKLIDIILNADCLIVDLLNTHKYIEPVKEDLKCIYSITEDEKLLKFI